MTDERIKELAEDFTAGMTDADFITSNDLTYLIRTVATEARAEGVDTILELFEGSDLDQRWYTYEIIDAIECLLTESKEQADD